MQANHAIKKSPSKAVFCHTTSHGDLPALKPLLNNKTLNRDIRAYLGGGKVRYDGHQAQRIHHDLSLREYSAIEWHHDHCGRRLKLFIFIENVDEDSHPTQIAEGTHNTLYYTTGMKKGGRYREQYVKDNHPIKTLTGPRGGGFIFDTNALHRGLREGGVVGKKGRTVVILEFHAHGKVQAMYHRGPWEPPCPSRKIAGKPGRGLPGFRLYPQEPAWGSSLV